MNPRERWQALQVHLSTARTLLEAGDADRALIEADAALKIDSAFLAAQSLRERILAAGATPAVRRAPWVSAPPVPLDTADSAAGDRAREQRSEIRRRQSAPSALGALLDRPQPTDRPQPIADTRRVELHPLTDSQLREEAQSLADTFRAEPQHLSVPLHAEAQPRVEPPADEPQASTVSPRSEPQPLPDPLPDEAQPQAVAPGDEPHALADLPLRSETLPPPAAPDTSYGKFEQRAKRRRVDRRLEAARAALDERRLRDAGVALDEVLDLDPNAPELATLTTALDNLRRAQTPPRHGAWLIAALVFGATLLGATWLENERAPLSHPMTAARSVITTPQPDAARRPADSNRAPLRSDALPDLVITDNVEPVREPPLAESAGTSGRADPAPPIATTPKTDPSASAPVSPAVSNAGSNAVASAPNSAAPTSKAVAPASNSVAPASNGVAPATNSVSPAVTMPEPASMSALPIRSTPPPAEAPSTPSPDASPAVVSPSPSVAAPPPAASATSASTPSASSSPASAAPASIPAVDDAGLVREALRRYRIAYNGLDAGSAQAVWPAVDEGALARAFDGLESQTLTFDDCRVQLRSDAATATATCRGTARYVPKVGSREPRTEARVWTFSLRKNGSAWQINEARVGR